MGRTASLPKGRTTIPYFTLKLRKYRKYTNERQLLNLETGEEEDEGDVIIKSFRNERKRESTEKWNTYEGSC